MTLKYVSGRQHVLKEELMKNMNCLSERGTLYGS
jgi:hypothetical protein